MSNSSIFRVYLSQPLRGEFALVIVSAKREQHDFVSEYFAVVHAKERKLFSRKFRVDNAAWLESQFQHTVESECDSALVAVQSTLDGYILDKFETTGIPYYSCNLFDLPTIPEIRLLTYWMQGLFNEEFEYIAKWTQSDSLRELLYKILQAPKFRDSEFPKQAENER